MANTQLPPEFIAPEGVVDGGSPAGGPDAGEAVTRPTIPHLPEVGRVLWLDADQGLSVVPEDFVVEWRSVEGIAFRPPEASAAPFYRQEGGTPFVYFVDYENLVGELGADLSSSTVFVRFRLDSGENSAAYRYLFRTSIETRYDDVLGAAFVYYNLVADGGSRQYTTSAVVDEEKWHTLRLVRDETGGAGQVFQRIYLNGTEVGFDYLAEEAIVPATGELDIGRNLGGGISEMLVFDRVVTSSEAVLLEDYLEGQAP